MEHQICRKEFSFYIAAKHAGSANARAFKREPITARNLFQFNVNLTGNCYPKFPTKGRIFEQFCKISFVLVAGFLIDGSL